MIAKLAEIAVALTEMEAAVRSDQQLPAPADALAVATQLNVARTALVALDVALRARHNERHPMRPNPKDHMPSLPHSVHDSNCGCQPVLDAETRLEIDLTP